MLLAVIATLDLDHRLVDHFFDPGVAGFPARHGWWADGVGHGGERLLVLGTLALAAGTWCLSFVIRRAAALGRASACVLCVLVSVQTVVVSLPHATALPCPRPLLRARR